MNSGAWGAAVGRRRFLALAAQGAVAAGSALAVGSTLAGCAGCPQAAGTGTAVPTLAPVPDVPLQPAGPYSIGNLLSTKNFYIAHRGSGDNWPEHTMLAYSQSVALGLKAIEVSVWASSDGVLLCHHDASTLRTTGHDFQIPATPYAALAQLRVDARAWLGPATAQEPIPRLRDVLDAFARSHVIFLEDKGGTNADAIITMLQDYPDSRDHIVWKQPAMSPGHLYARQRGYTTWGYFTSKELDRAADFQDRVDLLGVPTLAAEAPIRQLVALGKPVIAWEVHRRWERDRLQRLGVRGMMCSNVPYVLQRLAPASTDSLGQGSRAAGDLPWKTDSDWAEQPAFVDDALRFGGAAGSYTVGSMAPLAAPGWRLDVELRWPDGGGTGGQRAGIAFALGDDSPVLPVTNGAAPAATQGGYRLEIGADGSLELGRTDKGQVQPVSLASAAGGAGSGQWLRVRVEMAPVGIRASASADGGRTWSVQSNDTAFRGGYFALLSGTGTPGNDGGAAVEFRNLAVTALSVQEMCLV
ncbi:glycerophosphodiester phosphodiesterase [Arthrobacter cupressi]|uniref:Glycerophosphoryl diester phosphodiesterase n=1 Tax=Arthrobacter cupressi TaxID=1045773 RepID=A0A1G8IYB5_9MICC|nr:glycerophosphodiester phosphodiesterase [Arthrobacter cupressi]NYD79170.1 glycerophosphoryl diester phosphodiesterase [Arthrobacter cupressi]SDI24038.1 Glycerophosphoryl diester phosphodiesterase [Arthrobacter cupressi]